MNRIIQAIEKTKKQIETRLANGLVTPEKVDSLSKSLNMDFEEYFRFQELKSAHAGSRLTLDEAQTVYGFLGNTVEHFNQQPVEVKSVLTKIFSELL